MASVQVEVDGLAIEYDEVGEGRPILMLHGWPGSRVMMTNQLEPVFEGRPGWRRLYPDLPGMGRTKGPAWITDGAGMLRTMLRFIEALAPGEQCAVVGVSSGGYFALGMLHEQPERIAGLALWTPSVGLGTKTRIPEHHVFVHDPAVDEELAEEERPWLGVSVIQTPEMLAAFRRNVKPGLIAADHTFLERIAPHVHFPFDAHALAAPFERPTLLLAGHQDSIVGHADLVDMLPSFPRATLAVLDRAGHALAEEQKRLFRALFGDWLDRMALDAARET